MLQYQQIIDKLYINVNKNTFYFTHIQI